MEKLTLEVVRCQGFTPFAYNRITDRLLFTARNLSFKRHTVRVVATDEAGNVAIRSWSFTVKK
ncbi:MAG: hypothetical protein H0U65_13620 [Rubrobacter sp.]|nr:hypothetical protein [Rubrobacter sp.]